MKTAFVLFSALAALAAAAPAPSDDLVARGLQLVKKETQCKDCIDNCRDIGGLGDEACKVVICAIQCVITDA
ncbi:hypothetical protein CC79DRAFT_1394065 [Sarocladium strictum]